MTKKREKAYKKSEYRIELKEIIYNLDNGHYSNYNIKRLKGVGNLRRLRKGKIRIVFEKKGNILIIRKIDTRGSVYKNLYKI